MYINTSGREVPLNESFEFSTPLSIDECRERLERSAARTLEFRANVRVGKTYFLVEVQSDHGRIGLAYAGQLYTIAELRGTLRSQATGTLIKAECINMNIERKYRWMIPVPPVLFLLIGIGMGLSNLDEVTSGFVLLILAAAGGFAFVFYLLFEWSVQSVDRQIPDLREWLHKVLDAIPGSERQ